MDGVRPELTALQIGDPPGRWTTLGFTVESRRVALGGVVLELGAAGSGITGWTLSGIEEPVDGIDGLGTAVADRRQVAITTEHANGAVEVDHFVIVTPDFDRTARALESHGLALRRTRDAGGFRQGFRRLGPAIMEIVEAREAPPGPARFWGLTLIVPDLDGLRERLAPHVSVVRPAVQPGRHIATLSRSAGLSLPVAFMDPEAV